MNSSIFRIILSTGKSIQLTMALLLIASIITLPGCGSTKVYTADKTLVYGSNLYNLSNVSRLGSRVTVRLPDGEKVQMETLDKRAVEKLLDEHSTLLVTTSIEMDERDFTYQNVNVKSYSEFSKVIKHQQSTMKKINKFMADKKARQLKLK